MTTQILNNLSLASLPVIIGAIVIGLGLTGLLLWIISRGRPHQSTDIQTAALFSRIDLLQAERQRCDADQANGSINAEEHATACRDIDRRLLGLSTEMDRLGQSGTSILTPRNISISLLMPALSLVARKSPLPRLVPVKTRMRQQPRFVMQSRQPRHHQMMLRHGFYWLKQQRM